jgi:hypothetical protein
MRKYAVRLIYPDLYAPGCPNVSVSYHILANTPEEAEQKAFYYALAAVKDMLKRIGENPYMIDVIAFDLIKVKHTKIWEDRYNAY